MNKTDAQLKNDIEMELSWDPKVNASQIGVTVDHGAVSLLGAVDTYAEKWGAEDAVKRVSGVRTVAEDLTVKVLASHKRSDSEIASAALTALKWHVFVPSSVTARVEKGCITLEGQVQWNFQREAAGNAVRYLPGVVSMYNCVTLKPQVNTDRVKESVLEALQRQATADSESIHVEASGGKVTLTGSASSWQSIRDASSAAWATPGVTEVAENVTCC